MLENSMLCGAQAQIDADAAAAHYSDDLEDRARTQLEREFCEAAARAALDGWDKVTVERYAGGVEPIQNRMPLEEGTQKDWLTLVSAGLRMESGEVAAAARRIVSAAAEEFADDFVERRMNWLEQCDLGA